MRKEPKIKYYANGIELKDGDFLKAKTLFKEKMPETWKAFLEDKLLIEKSPLTCETEYENLQANTNIRTIKNDEFIFFMHKEYRAIFEGREYTVVVKFMRLTNKCICN